MLVLASSSPYRRMLLERLHVSFETARPDVIERAAAGEAPAETALRLAQEKARALLGRYPRAVIIGSDQVADLNGRAMGKPGSREAALVQLEAMCGATVHFHTAVCVLGPSRDAMQIELVPTSVRFRSYSAAQAARYLDLDEPYDCAGSAKIESLGIALVEQVDSPDPTALIGLPLIALTRMLAKAGVRIL